MLQACVDIHYTGGGAACQAKISEGEKRGAPAGLAARREGVLLRDEGVAVVHSPLRRVGTGGGVDGGQVGATGESVLTYFC